ncbi:hypothetical protein ONZ43_g3193 [Nemania bipapillata]|uniref:Uncharacterized protein n=1 Tax=Nemania bipapillata TaxID=110536 RepID=A0ACC2IY33_9PEZI|nr:hypothetical protein ONZ43_g3193 [Nemania bipapillata]
MVSTVSPSSPFYSPSPYQPQRKKTMSITQTYFLAHKARAKLSTEAARPDHNLRLLVGHANLLDSLMLDLADAEREQESWFNQSVRGAAPKTQERHIQWADSAIEEEEDWEADSSDSDDDSDMDDDEDIEMFDAALSRIPSHVPVPSSPKLHTMETDEEDFEEDEESFAHLGLTRTASHSASPPELEHDSESSEDESMPPSPPTTTIPTFSQKQNEGTIGTKYYSPAQDEEEDKSDFYNEGFYLPPRNPNRLISAISVY